MLWLIYYYLGGIEKAVDAALWCNYHRDIPSAASQKKLSDNRCCRCKGAAGLESVIKKCYRNQNHFFQARGGKKSALEK